MNALYAWHRPRQPEAEYSGAYRGNAEAKQSMHSEAKGANHQTEGFSCFQVSFKYLIYVHTGIFSYFFDWFTRASCCYNVDWCKLDDISQVYVGSQGREVHGVPTGPSQTLPQKISFQPTKDYLYAVTATMCEEFLSCLHQWHRTHILLVPIFGENECMISNNAIASCCASTCRRP